jgi:hypothetical protein
VVRFGDMEAVCAGTSLSHTRTGPVADPTAADAAITADRFVDGARRSIRS